MLLLYSCQLLMLVAGLFILAVPFLQHKHSLVSKPFVSVASGLTLVAILCYAADSDRPGLQAWLQGGQAHYRLLATFQQLGGAEIAITSILQHLNAQPNDGKAWLLLGKLYLGKKDVADAKIALTKAHTLLPDDAELNALFSSMGW